MGACGALGACARIGETRPFSLLACGGRVDAARRSGGAAAPCLLLRATERHTARQAVWTAGGVRERDVSVAFSVFLCCLLCPLPPPPPPPRPAALVCVARESANILP